MGKKLTTEEYINRARATHGDIYDYSLTDYQGAYKIVKIICKQHGVFEQMATNHTNGYGCPDTDHRAKHRTIPTRKSFIDRAEKYHGKYYNYDLVELSKINDIVKIICPEHGIFDQAADKHISGTGCPNHAHRIIKLRDVSFAEVLQRAIDAHGDLYDYSLLESSFLGMDKKGKIICPNHGVFEQILSDHVEGHGCSRCAGCHHKTTDEFIQEAIKIHEYYYDYSLVDYININTCISIICPMHGIFQQKPVNHLQGYDCNECGIISKTLSQDEVITRSNIIHNYKYDYSLVKYINTSTKINIICPNHGVFSQKPSNHMVGHGCARCIGSISIVECKWLDSLSILDEYRQYVLYIDGKQYRLDAFDPITNTIYEFYGDYWHGNPKLFDSNKVHPTKKITFGQLYYNTLKREKILKMAGYNIISIWEHDWNQLQKSTQAMISKIA